MTCPHCHEPVVTAELASTGRYVLLNGSPDPERGDLHRLSDGRDRGKYVRLGGPLLDKARREGLLLYTEHAGCAQEGLF